jgi:uncharacterized protein (TIGR03086 family)
MDSETFGRAVSASRPVIASVKPEQMGDSTPCESWKVRDLVNHMIDAPAFAATVMETGDFANHKGGGTDHVEAGDYVAAYDAVTERALAAFRADGAMEKMVKLPFGELPGSVFLGIASGDAFVHGWDLAKSTGGDTDVDPALAAEILEAVTPLLPEEMRGPDGKAPFGPVVEVPADASATDRLAGFLGRRP